MPFIRNEEIRVGDVLIDRNGQPFAMVTEVLNHGQKVETTSYLLSSDLLDFTRYTMPYLPVLSDSGWTIYPREDVKL